MIDRRRFISGVALGFVALPLAAEAQQAGKVYRIGFLGLNSAAASQYLVAPFRQGLREHGWVDGQKIVIEFRFADGSVDRLPAVVAELINLKVDILVVGSSVATWAAKDATKIIPIVMVGSVDPVGEGLVASLAHPSGNVTGMAFLVGPEIAGKQLELLMQVTPTASRVAVLTNPTNRAHTAFVKELQIAARSRGAQLQVLEARSPDQIDGAFAAISKERAAALLLLADGMFFGQRRRLADLTVMSRLPALGSQREFVDAGGLMSYGPSLADMYRRAATFVDKILKGAKPGDLPIEQPSKFELVINVKTAKAFGVTIPQSLLLRADEVIQ